MTYEQMLTLANKYAQILRQHGMDDVEVLDVEPGDPIDIAFIDPDSPSDDHMSFVLSLDVA